MGNTLQRRRRLSPAELRLSQRGFAVALAEENFGWLYKAWLKNQLCERKPLLSVYPATLGLVSPAPLRLYLPRVLEGGRGEALLPHKPCLSSTFHSR